MSKYLNDYRVTTDKKTNAVERPKRNTLNTIRSHLKTALSEVTGYNFSDAVLFSGLANATATIHKEIKKVGR